MSISLIKDYMKSMNEYAETINEDALYDNLINGLQKAKEEGKPLNEGILMGLLGGTTAAIAGPTIMKAVCNVLGIDQKGPLGSLMTSRLILTAMAGKLGMRA